jgi:5-methylcytosine-specific restriction enzyme subunit McrC
MQMPAEGEGDHALVALLKDELTFHLLFERFVRNFYHFHLEDYRVIRDVTAHGFPLRIQSPFSN